MLGDVFLMEKICIVTLIEVFNLYKGMKVSRTMFTDIHHTFGVYCLFGNIPTPA